MLNILVLRQIISRSKYTEEESHLLIISRRRGSVDVDAEPMKALNLKRRVAKYSK